MTFPVAAHAQGLRWDIGAPGSAGVVTTAAIGGLPALLAQPGVTLAWCSYPAIGLPCTNFATTYTSISLVTPCPTNTPIVLQGSTTCQGTADNFGAMGVWVPTNTTCSGITCYTYTLTVNGVSYGPYVWTSGGAGGGGGVATTQGPYALMNCAPDLTGNSFYTVTSLSSMFFGHWEFVYNGSFPTYINCTLKLPHLIPVGTPKLVLDSLSSSESVAGHTMTFATCDVLVTTSIATPTPVCAPTQTFTTAATAYAPVVLTFNLQSTPTADSLLIVQVKATAEASLIANVLMGGAFLEWQ